MRKLHAFGLLIAMSTMTVLSTNLAVADPRLTEFMSRFAKLDRGSSNYRHPDNMFFPYRVNRFANGLAHTEKTAFDEASTGLQCKLAGVLLTRGFLNLFPFLKKPFKSALMFDQLVFRMRYARLPELVRCDALQSILQIAERNPDAVSGPVNMLEEFLGREHYSIHPLHQQPRQQLVDAWYRLGKLAFCDDYLPAIRDLLSRSHRSGGVALTHFDAAYLLGRSIRRPVHRDIYKAVLETLKLSEDEHRFIIQKIKQARRHKVGEFNYSGGSWQGVCTVR